MLEFLPAGVKTVLDVGCGEGFFAAHIKQEHDIEAWGIELMKVAGEIASKKLDEVLIGSCDTCIDKLPDNYFDAIFFNDVIEHLVDPYTVLSACKEKLSPRGVIISSIPNIRFHRNLADLVFGKNWDYADDGIMDKTHLRFFTINSIRKMYENLGFEVVSHQGINKSKSLRPILFNIPFLFTAMDIRFPQYATVVRDIS